MEQFFKINFLIVLCACLGISSLSKNAYSGEIYTQSLQSIANAVVIDTYQNNDNTGKQSLNIESDSAAHSGQVACPRLQMATSPDGGAVELVLATIAAAKKSIYVACFAFTSRAIAQALIDKYHDGVEVRIVMDKSQQLERNTMVEFLSNAGLPVRINSRYAAQHSKIMIVDKETVETGSFNFTFAASKRNSENVLVVWRCPSLAQQYQLYWQRLWDEAEPYVGNLILPEVIAP